MRADLLDRYTVDANGCWVWNGSRMNGGYGVVRHCNRSFRAHRLSYEAHKGPIPVGHEIDHTCENPPCINPAHLDAVTRPEHIRRTQQRLGKDHLHLAALDLRRRGQTWQEIADALGWANKASAFAAVMTYAPEKGLVAAEELPRKRFLTDEDRAEMVAMYRAGSTQREIGEAFGIHSSHVSRVVRGMTSGHDRPPARARKDQK